MSDPLALLARTDKWFLSATDGIAYAPLFPGRLHLPRCRASDPSPRASMASTFVYSDGRRVTDGESRECVFSEPL
ncbi:MAG: hypothetical protein ABI889_13190, partial [Gemmatimonadota bacterium]